MKSSILLMPLLLSLSVTMTLTSSHITSATPENWSEVATFTGTYVGHIETKPAFTIGYADWRIRWSFNATAQDISAMLVVYAYPQGNSTYVNLIYGSGNDTSGVSYVHDLAGTFYMTVATGPSTVNYTLIVEQDLDAIPEFPSSATVSLILVAAFLLATVSLITTKRRLNRSGSALKIN